MALFTVTVDVRDFEASGPPPVGASLDIARAVPAFVGDRIISARVDNIPLVSGLGSTELNGGDYYSFLFRGVRGLGRKWWARMPYQDVSVAELWRNYQATPSTPGMTTSIYIDTDGTPYFIEGGSIFFDTDDVPYFVDGGDVLIDTDGVPYFPISY